jgi:hypothetical protein
VHALLPYLRAAGFEGAPQPLGIDELGREVLTLSARDVPVMASTNGTVMATTVRFSGWTYAQLARIVRTLCIVAGRGCLPLVAAVAVSSAKVLRR